MEQCSAVGVAADRVPLDGDEEVSLVVGQDPPGAVEGAATLGQQGDLDELVGVDLFLGEGGLAGLEEPEPGPQDTPKQDGGSEQHGQTDVKASVRHEGGRCG